jgi:hypothetical protein
MSYKEFSWKKAKKDFNLTTVEGERFLPPTPLVNASPELDYLLAQNIPWAIAVGNEKARSEAIINPVLLESRRILKNQISVFSGEEFNVDPSVGLNGYCDFLIARSNDQLTIEAPAIVLIESKKEDLKKGMGQCLASMVAAQRFNEENGAPIKTIYGSVSSGTTWRFMKLEEQTVTVDFTDYPLPPTNVVLGMLIWMIEQV